MIWEHAVKLHPESLVYIGPRKLLSRLFYSTLAKLVRKSERFSFVKNKIDKRLPAKTLVYGVKVDNKAKAYPISLFDPKKPELIEDNLAGRNLSILYHNGSIYGFLESGLSIHHNKLVKNNKNWTFAGQPVNHHEPLTQITITEKAYWYMWSYFNPETEIYEK